MLGRRGPAFNWQPRTRDRTSATAPEGYVAPTLEEIEKALPSAIAKCASLFAEPRITRVRFAQTEASAKASKSKEKEKAEKEKEARGKSK